MDPIQLHDRVDHDLTNHPIPDDQDVENVELLREHAKALGHAIVEWCPPGREQSLALTQLEQTVMWAVAAIARA